MYKQSNDCSSSYQPLPNALNAGATADLSNFRSRIIRYSSRPPAGTGLDETQLMAPYLLVSGGISAIRHDCSASAVDKKPKRNATKTGFTQASCRRNVPVPTCLSHIATSSLCGLSVYQREPLVPTSTMCLISKVHSLANGNLKRAMIRRSDG